MRVTVIWGRGSVADRRGRSWQETRMWAVEWVCQKKTTIQLSIRHLSPIWLKKCCFDVTDVSLISFKLAVTPTGNLPTPISRCIAVFTNKHFHVFSFDFCIWCCTFCSSGRWLRWKVLPASSGFLFSHFWETAFSAFKLKHFLMKELGIILSSVLLLFICLLMFKSSQSFLIMRKFESAYLDRWRKDGLMGGWWWMDDAW